MLKGDEYHLHFIHMKVNIAHTIISINVHVADIV